MRKQEELMASQNAAEDTKDARAAGSKMRRGLRRGSEARREKRRTRPNPEKPDQDRRRHWMDRMREAEATKKDKKAASQVSPRFSAALTPAAMEKYRKAKAAEEVRSASRATIILLEALHL